MIVYAKTDTAVPYAFTLRITPGYGVVGSKNTIFAPVR